MLCSYYEANVLLSLCILVVLVLYVNMYLNILQMYRMQLITCKDMYKYMHIDYMCPKLGNMLGYLA
jgi:hypothetical protein